MLITTTDPITGNDVKDTSNASYIIEGEGENALKIFFESEQSKQVYLDFLAESDESISVEIYNQISNNEEMGTIN